MIAAPSPLPSAPSQPRRSKRQWWRRADAPLRAAADAVVIDTSDMGIDEAVARAAAVVEMVLKARR